MDAIGTSQKHFDHARVKELMNITYPMRMLSNKPVPDSLLEFPFLSFPHEVIACVIMECMQ